MPELSSFIGTAVFQNLIPSYQNSVQSYADYVLLFLPFF
jgi:hypothetical protein